ncbi:MAG: T9SS type A sorting domain-containing protein [Paludibacter sp.]|nr:T9SS type A sorting domain-containing protein [Paludibacter sp.]
MKKVLMPLGVAVMAFLMIQQVAAQTPRVQYSFNAKANTDSILDETGNGYNGKLMGSAQIKKLGRFSLLKIGATSGYVDLGAKMGQVISGLSNFTISTYLYVDPSAVLTNAGNFVWTFSNSADINANASGCMFYTAKDSRYAICSTNYTNEKTVNIASAATKGSWKHITYTQSGTSGVVYIDGVQKKTGTINLLPTTLGSTSFNYLCKSAYASDQILLNSMLCDFRIYNSALNATQVAALATNMAALDTATFKDVVDTAVMNLSLGDLSAVTTNLTLPATGSNSTTIQWSSSNTGVISNAGVVTRPANGSANATVVLTATITKSFISKTKTFTATVIPAYSNQNSVDADVAAIALIGNLTNLRSNISLPVSGNEGSTIAWSSNTPAVLSNAGAIVTRPAKGNGNAQVTLTATVTKGTAVATKAFSVSVAEDEGFSAYLFAYFTGNSISQEAFRFALSDDGFVYKALNGNNPVISSAAVSSSGGIRDPHILRGQNNDYLMVATDMVSALGWNSNRAMILLKSTNLTTWTSVVVNIPNTYSQYAAADRVWAPQTIYDPTVGKYMVYFAMRLGSTDYDKIYYAYANSTFTGLESAPQVLFDNNGLSTIDADIVLKDGVYNLFFKTEGNGNGIKKATSTTLTGGYVLYDKYLQSTTNAVEGGCVYRMYNTDNWILIYDMYTSGAYQFTTSTDLMNFSVVPNTVSFDFTPRHGTIIPITAAEKQALNAKWGVTAIANNEAAPIFSIYPNPATDFLNVTMNNAANKGMKVAIYDFKGSKLLEKEQTTTTERINISTLKSGIYMITCSDTNGFVSAAKFVIR